VVSLRSEGSYLDVTYPERRVAADPEHPEVLEHYELSGTSMASPMVAATAALMIQQDPGLDPANIKARLMLSARKPTVADPFTTGAGALDILAALRTYGSVGGARSPLVFPDQELGGIDVEETAELWGDPVFAIQAIWAGSVLWGSGGSSQSVTTQAVLWPDSTTPYALLWPDSLPEAVLWPDTTIWGEAVLWPDSIPDDIILEDHGELVDDP
jgi:hypothetical protein